MSMSPEQENFEQLRRLLTLKRHEQPPPGYFDHFSRRVIIRIQAGETGHDGVMASWFGRAEWLRRTWELFEAKPVFAGAFGMAVCGLLFCGIIFSEKTASPGLTGASFAETPSVDLLQLANRPNNLLLEQPELVGYDLTSTGAINGFQARGSAIFEGLGMPKATRADLTFPMH
jgi:hypothetical protein